MNRRSFFAFAAAMLGALVATVLGKAAPEEPQPRIYVKDRYVVIDLRK